MSEPLNQDTDTTVQVPAYVPDDLVHAWLWCRENGTQWLVTLAVAVLLAVGFSMFQRNREAQAARAAQQLLVQNTTLDAQIESLEKTIADFSSTPAGTAAKLKLAKAYYDARRYTDALTKYDEFIKENGSFPFADVARVGRGYALCGLNRLDEAIDAFRTFRAKNPGHYLTQQTLLGEAACLTIQGKKDAAKAMLEDLRAASRETPWESAAKRMEGAIDRYQARPVARTLFDQANALAPVAAPAAPAPAAAPAKP